jgi:hypothetical protein
VLGEGFFGGVDSPALSEKMKRTDLEPPVAGIEQALQRKKASNFRSGAVPQLATRRRDGEN